MSILRFFTIEAVSDLFQEFNRGMFSFYFEVKFGSLVSFLDPPETIEDGVGPDSISDIQTGAFSEVSSQRSSMLEDFEFQGMGVYRYSYFEWNDRITFVSKCAFDKFNTAKKSLE